MKHLTVLTIVISVIFLSSCSSETRKRQHRANMELLDWRYERMEAMKAVKSAEIEFQKAVELVQQYGTFDSELNMLVMFDIDLDLYQEIHFSTVDTTETSTIHYSHNNQYWN